MRGQSAANSASIAAAVQQYSVRSGLFATGGKLLVAVSGGADSMALLHILITLSGEMRLQLHVATLDHQLRGEASRADADFVRVEAERLGVTCIVGSIDVLDYATTQRVGIEQAARAVRYRFLVDTAHALQIDTVATAHTQDDQAETVLMHLIRGAGLTGLSGMKPKTALMAGITLVRPLLNTTRADIDLFLEEIGLIPRLDATNQDTRYTRNRVRLELLPLLRTFNPAISKTLTTTAETLRADHDALAALIPPYPYARAVFGALPVAVQRMALRTHPAWRENLDFEAVEEALVFIRAGNTGLLRLSDRLTLCCGFTRITLSLESAPLLPLDAPAMQPGTIIRVMDGSAQVFPLLNGWTALIQFTATSGAIAHASEADDPQTTVFMQHNDTLILRTWQNGDRYQPEGMNGHHQKLSDTLINLGVPRAWRPYVPLVIHNDQIIAFVVPTSEGLKLRRAHAANRVNRSPNDAPSSLCVIRFLPPTI